VSAGARDRQQVALTFHVSGDRPIVVRLLDLLRERHTPITAFVVGTWLDANRDLATRFADDGHEIANHTYTHLTFSKLDRAQMTSEIVRCRDLLVATTGQPGRFFRPSGTNNGTDDPGSAVHDVAHEAGYTIIAGFDVDPSDYADPGARAVVDRTDVAVQPGSIVSLHFGHTGTIDALPQILGALSTRSLQPVTLSTLLG
jgi:peptidoglycan/xylan/chitin deacetylase (PgdA/CDA1 family)